MVASWRRSGQSGGCTFESLLNVAMICSFHLYFSIAASENVSSSCRPPQVNVAKWEEWNPISILLCVSLYFYFERLWASSFQNYSKAHPPQKYFGSLYMGSLLATGEPKILCLLVLENSFHISSFLVSSSLSWLTSWFGFYSFLFYIFKIIQLGGHVSFDVCHTYKMCNTKNKP